MTQKLHASVLVIQNAEHILFVYLHIHAVVLQGDGLVVQLTKYNPGFLNEIARRALCDLMEYRDVLGTQIKSMSTWHRG